MSKSIRMINNFEPSGELIAKGLFSQDREAITQSQRECAKRLSKSLQLEHESYLMEHPEIAAMLKVFVGKSIYASKRNTSFLKEISTFFLQSSEKLDEEIREQLKIGPEGPYNQGNKHKFRYDDGFLQRDLRNINKKFNDTGFWSGSSSLKSFATLSSDFISIKTSDTTLPTPEKARTPTPTVSQDLFGLITKSIDKAVFSRVDDYTLRYDTAYVELTKAVEMAMEIPVEDIKADIAWLFNAAYQMFEADIVVKEIIAAEIAWENRMRKKLKRTLRRQKNFKGYETPLSPKSEISSHPSYKIPPFRPCVCTPAIHYNRYAKDRFGIYLPRTDVLFSPQNLTLTPAMSLEKLDVEKKETT